jgi:hypothetical protein
MLFYPIPNWNLLCLYFSLIKWFTHPSNHRIKLVSCYKVLILYNIEGNVNSIINPNCKVYYMLLNIIATEYSLFFVKLWYSNICNQINYGIRYNAGKLIE